MYVMWRFVNYCSCITAGIWGISDLVYGWYLSEYSAMKLWVTVGREGYKKKKGCGEIKLHVGGVGLMIGDHY